MHPDAYNDLLAVFGADRCRSAVEDRLTYAYDAVPGRHLPDVVVFPLSADEIARCLAVARRWSLPVTPRGAGTGLTGGAVAASGGVLLCLDRLNRIVEIDTANLLAVVEAGVVTADLHAAAEAQGLFYPPDPASSPISTIGGNIAENSGGMRAVKYGVTGNYVMGLEVVLASGQIVHTGSKCVKDVVGYDLTRLFVGSEGTLGIVTRAILKLRPFPEARGLVAAAFASLDAAAAVVPALFAQRVIPSCLEFMDDNCLRAVQKVVPAGFPADARALLLIEVDGHADTVRVEQEQVQRLCRAHRALEVRTAVTADAQAELWRARRAVHGGLINLAPHWEEEDLSVPVASVPAMVAKVQAIGRAHDLLTVCFGHFGDGNIHVSYAPGPGGPDPQRLHAARHEMLDAAVALEGRIAAEHGIGMAKRDWLGWNLDLPTIELMRTVKRALDPEGRLNPGKLFPRKTQDTADDV